jgi:hypothetical protein
MLSGWPNKVGGRDSTSSRLEEFRRQQRRRTKALRLIGYFCVLVGSFSATQLIFYLNDESEELKRAALREALTEVESAQSKAVPVVSGFRVYSPSTGAGDHFSPDRAFDGSRNPNSFWEAHHFPVSLIALLPQSRILSTYTISAGAITNRMPTTWVLEGFSEDRALWITLDQQKGVSPWGPDETRSFRIETAVPVNALRFQFRAGFDPEILRIYEIGIH